MVSFYHQSAESDNIWDSISKEQLLQLENHLLSHMGLVLENQENNISAGSFVGDNLQEQGEHVQGFFGQVVGNETLGSA